MVLSPFCWRTFRTGQCQGPVPSLGVLPLQQSFSCLRAEASDYPSVLWWVWRHLHVDLRDRSKEEFATMSTCYCISVMARFHNGLQSLLLHNYKHNISCSIWEMQKKAKECSIFITVHVSTLNPPVIRPAETALEIDLSYIQIISARYFVLHVGQSAVLWLCWKLGNKYTGNILNWLRKNWKMFIFVISDGIYIKIGKLMLPFRFIK